MGKLPFKTRHEIADVMCTIIITFLVILMAILHTALP